jgi:hypothetical protein
MGDALRAAVLLLAAAGPLTSLPRNRRWWFLPLAVTLAAFADELGVLRWRQEYNVLHTVTGADRDSIGGALWIGQEA